MGEIRVNLTNFITIGLMAFVFLFLFKKGAAFVAAKTGAANA